MIIISILLGVVIAYLFLKKFSEVTGTICLIRGMIGIPCPSCGMSRAIITILNGDFISAFRYHPLFWLPFVILISSIITRRHFKKILIVSIIVFSGIYIIRMINLFPDIEPMKYNEKAIFKIDIRLD